MKAELMKRWREREFPGLSEAMADLQLKLPPSVIAAWIIDIVADAHEIQTRPLTTPLHSPGYGAGYSAFVHGDTGDPQTHDEDWVAGFAAAQAHHETDPRLHRGFTHTSELAGGIERASVSITAEHIEALWSKAEDDRLGSDTLALGFDRLGQVGRFMLWSQHDGAVWATCPDEPDMRVLVVKPEPSP